MKIDPKLFTPFFFIFGSLFCMAVFYITPTVEPMDLVKSAFNVQTMVMAGAVGFFVGASIFGRFIK